MLKVLQVFAIKLCHNDFQVFPDSHAEACPTLIAGIGVEKYMVVSSSYRCCSTVDLDTEICSSFDTIGTTLEKIVDIVFSISLDVPNEADSWQYCAALSDDVK